MIIIWLVPLGNWNVWSQLGLAIDKPWLLVGIHKQDTFPVYINQKTDRGLKQIQTAKLLLVWWWWMKEK